MKTLPLAALAVAAVAGGAWYLSQPATTPGLTSFTPANAQEAGESATAATVDIQEMTLGNPAADVQVIEYASFTCPHCATFHDTVLPTLKEDYIDTGKIGFTYREVYFDRFGLWAGMVARCAGDQDKYFGISDLIYERQREWTDGEPVQIADNLKKLGKTAGLTEDQLTACLSDGTKAEALYADFQANAEADEITSTPSFIINGEKYSNMSAEEFARILDEKLGDDS